MAELKIAARRKTFKLDVGLVRKLLEAEADEHGRIARPALSANRVADKFDQEVRARRMLA